MIYIDRYTYSKHSVHSVLKYEYLGLRQLFKLTLDSYIISISQTVLNCDRIDGYIPKID